MGSSGLVILLIAVAFFVVVGLSATSGLIDDAKASNDTHIANAASGASSTMSPLWATFGIGIIIVGVFAVIHSYSKM